MRTKAPSIPKESPEEAARRQAEEARVLQSQLVADRNAVDSAQRIATQRTRRVFRLFGASNAASFGGGVGGTAALSLADFSSLGSNLGGSIATSGGLTLQSGAPFGTQGRVTKVGTDY